MEIETSVFVRPRRFKRINAKNINNMDDAQDPCGNGEDAIGKKPRHPQGKIKSLKCWRCGGPHLCCSYSHWEVYVRPAYNIQENEIEADGKGEHESSPDVAATIRSLRVELQVLKE